MRTLHGRLIRGRALRVRLRCLRLRSLRLLWLLWLWNATVRSRLHGLRRLLRGPDPRGLRQQMEQRPGNGVTQAHLGGPVNGQWCGQPAGVHENAIGTAIVGEYPGPALEGQGRVHT